MTKNGFGAIRVPPVLLMQDKARRQMEWRETAFPALDYHPFWRFAGPREQGKEDDAAPIACRKHLIDAVGAKDRGHGSAGARSCGCPSRPISNGVCGVAHCEIAARAWRFLAARRMEGRIEKHMVEGRVSSDFCRIRAFEADAIGHLIAHRILIGESDQSRIDFDAGYAQVRNAPGDAQAGNSRARSQFQHVGAWQRRYGRCQQHGVMAGAESSSGLRNG
jgi:hypothetical protein